MEDSLFESPDRVPLVLLVSLSLLCRFVSLLEDALVAANLALEVLSDIVHASLVVHLSNNTSLAVSRDGLCKLRHTRHNFSVLAGVRPRRRAIAFEICVAVLGLWELVRRLWT